MVHRLYGEGACVHVAERIGALALAGDDAGVKRWREIARRLDQLLRPEGAGVNDGERFSYLTAAIELAFFAWPFVVAAGLMLWLRG